MMVPDESLHTLHDRATRGGVLSPEEQAQLDQWYAAQDAAELAALQSTATPAVRELQSHVAAVLARCITLTQRIQQLTDENDALRRDIGLLRQQVARLLQPA